MRSGQAMNTVSQRRCVNCLQAHEESRYAEMTGIWKERMGGGVAEALVESEVQVYRRWEGVRVDCT